MEFTLPTISRALRSLSRASPPRSNDLAWITVSEHAPPAKTTTQSFDPQAMTCAGISLPERYPSISALAAARLPSAVHSASRTSRSPEMRNDSHQMATTVPTRSTQTNPSVLPQEIRMAVYQCTPRISEAKAICSWLGADSFSALRSPLAAAESGNSSNAVFITTS